MKNLTKTKWFTFGTYLLLVLATLLIGFVTLQNNSTLRNVFISFFEVAENRTFDYRQTIKVYHKHPIPNNDIVFLAIDEPSLEYLWNKYGEWPIPRRVYADMVNYIEKQKPQSIVFDLLFLKSLKSDIQGEKYFVETMNKYDNIYTGLNFDDMTPDVRTPIDLPERIELKIDNKSNVNFKNKYGMQNCRPIMPELLNGKVHVGITNIVRGSDGIIRVVSPVLQYKDKFYPYLSFKAGNDYLKMSHDNTLVIDKKSNMHVAQTKIPLTKDGDAILNWYGKAGTHTTIPFYMIEKEMIGKAGTKFDFKDKIIIIGTTAQALHDTKSVPIQDDVYPGAEVQATFLNNMLDDNFIHKTGTFANFLIILAVIAIVGSIAMFSTSTLFVTLSTILFTIAYLFISYYVMELYNVWIPVIVPIIAIVLAYTLSLLTKYLLKSRDFEYQYKLATIDGLTELYNHRYFQDTLKQQMDIARRYNQSVSLIICDIDFFKKFNDTYGHQAGDAVLRQVAQTLKKNSRTTDYVCRYGGEEMSIILPNTNAEEALMLANRICAAVAEKPFHLTPVDTAPVTISLGVSTFPENAQTPQDLIEWADKGLYYAKEHGRNQVGRY